MTGTATLEQRLRDRAKFRKSMIILDKVASYERSDIELDREAAAAIASLRDANKALTAELENEQERVIFIDAARDDAEVKLEQLRGELRTERAINMSRLDEIGRAEADRDRLSAEQAEARNILEKSLHDFAPVSAQNHKRDVAAFLASKEASQ